MKTGDIWYKAVLNDNVEFVKCRVATIMGSYIEWSVDGSVDRIGNFEKDLNNINNANFKPTKTLALRGLIEQMTAKHDKLMADAEHVKHDIDKLNKIDDKFSHLRWKFLDDGRIEYIDSIGSTWYYDDGTLYIQGNDGTLVEEPVLEDVDRQEAEDWIRDASGEINIDAIKDLIALADDFDDGTEGCLGETLNCLAGCARNGENIYDSLMSVAVDFIDGTEGAAGPQIEKIAQRMK